MVCAWWLSLIASSPTKINQLSICQQFLIYRNITTPSLSYAHEHCRNPKKVSKKVATLEKTTVLYRSISLISLCCIVTTIFGTSALTSPVLGIPRISSINRRWAVWPGVDPVPSWASPTAAATSPSGSAPWPRWPHSSSGAGGQFASTLQEGKILSFCYLFRAGHDTHFFLRNNATT